MHIPDWDPRLLAKYDPAEMVRLYERAGVTSVMFYCQSHVGLCYWPTRTGRQHASLRGRDIVGEMLALLKAKGLDACGYYSVVFNNWAFLERPDWRIQASTPAMASGLPAGTFDRYGICCPNHPQYREFCFLQVDELTAYPFDGLFFDMTFWPRICVCAHCRERYRRETGAAIPETIDWCDPAWCAFQAARERWMAEFAGLLTDRAKAGRRGLSVYHNFASALCNWTLGLPFDAAAHSDFLGADFYGDSVEELVVGKLFSGLTRNRPLEFMTSRCVNLRDHERTKSRATLEMQSFATVLQAGAFLFIDAINPDGTANAPVYDRMRDVFQQVAPYEPWLGGQAVEDIAVYFSSASKMSFTENGGKLSDPPAWTAGYPHLKAVRGACRMLSQAHLPFGVITRRNLKDLSRYKVVVLPNVLRMDREEVDAFQAYVRDGGKLYASRFTSLTETSGVRHEDFMLADVFGCHFAATDAGAVAYLKMCAPKLEECIQPQRYLSHFPPPGTEGEGVGTLLLADRAEGEVLATLVRPYDRQWGTVFDRNWTSIHSSPPWQETETPVIVRHRFGKGVCVYAASDIECVESEANDRLFVRLIRDLAATPLAYGAEAHPAVWMNVFHEPERRRFRVCFLNYQKQLPAVPIAALPFHLRLPAGTRAARVVRVPDGEPVPFTVEPDGALWAEARNLEVFHMLAVEYEHI
jgi:hypothetical protein